MLAPENISDGLSSVLLVDLTLRRNWNVHFNLDIVSMVIFVRQADCSLIEC